MNLDQSYKVNKEHSEGKQENQFPVLSVPDVSYCNFANIETSVSSYSKYTVWARSSH